MRLMRREVSAAGPVAGVRVKMRLFFRLVHVGKCKLKEEYVMQDGGFHTQERTGDFPRTTSS